MEKCSRCGVEWNPGYPGFEETHSCDKPYPIPEPKSAEEIAARELAEKHFQRTQPWHSKKDLEYFQKPGNSRTIDAYLEGRAVAREELREKFLPALRVLRTVLDVLNLRGGREAAESLLRDFGD